MLAMVVCPNIISVNATSRSMYELKVFRMGDLKGKGSKLVVDQDWGHSGIVLKCYRFG